MDKRTYVEDEGIKFLRRRICVNMGTELVFTITDYVGTPELYGYGLVDVEKAATSFQTLP